MADFQFVPDPNDAILQFSECLRKMDRESLSVLSSDMYSCLVARLLTLAYARAQWTPSTVSNSAHHTNPSLKGVTLLSHQPSSVV